MNVPIAFPVRLARRRLSGLSLTPVLVNIIPLIAKADTMTPDECDDFKKEILREIETHKINIYEFPDHDDEEENRFVHGSE